MNHWTASLHHDGSPRYVAPAGRHGAPSEGHRLGDTVTLRLRADRDAPLAGVYLRTAPDGEQAFTPLHPAGADAACRWWAGELTLTMPRTNYRFYVVSNEGAWWLSAAGLTRHEPTDATDFKLLADYAAPGWVRDSVFYQIFPERFADGDPSNNIRDGETVVGKRRSQVMAWGDPVLPYQQGDNLQFAGGDLPGITQRLDYIAELGANAIYLNPIFPAPSDHKYNITDFKRVEAHFGGDAALIALRRTLDERGMRLILDITPNHCGREHPWFRAAQADPNAPTADYFIFHNHPDDYEIWLKHKSLVKLNYRSPGLRATMYGDQDAILRYWLREPFRIDGWRLDVANMTARQGAHQLHHEVWREIRAAVKETRPDAYLMGETFFDGSDLLQGDMLDGVMNYRGFALPMAFWLAGIESLPVEGPVAAPPLPSEALAAQWHAYLGAIPWQIAAQQFNLLGSHDTARVKFLLGGDTARLRVAVALLITFPGVPSIYYGDEIGLTGGPPPRQRGCMPWDPADWDHDLRAFYQRAIRLRRESPALRWGGFQVVYAAGDTVAFLRDAPQERLLIVAWRGDDGLAALPVRHAGLPDGVRLEEVLAGGTATADDGHLPLRRGDPVGVMIWRGVEHT